MRSTTRRGGLVCFVAENYANILPRISSSQFHAGHQLEPQGQQMTMRAWERTKPKHVLLFAHPARVHLSDSTARMHYPRRLGCREESKCKLHVASPTCLCCQNSCWNFPEKPHRKFNAGPLMASPANPAMSALHIVLAVRLHVRTHTP